MAAFVEDESAFEIAGCQMPPQLALLALSVAAGQRVLVCQRWQTLGVLLPHWPKSLSNWEAGPPAYLLELPAHRLSSLQLDLVPPQEQRQTSLLLP